MHKASRAVVALVIGSALGGCYHYTADIPGVLDTRSDGSTADASPPHVTDEELRRTGLSAVIEGDGVQAEGAHVRVEERHFFAGITALAPGAFLLSNESAKPELEAALGGDALREVRVGHQYSGFDVFLTAVTNLIPCVPLFLLPQPYTFQLTGERVASSGQPPVNRPVAPPVEVEPPAVEPPAADAAPDDAEADAAAPKSDETKPNETKPDDTKPDDTKADEAKADEAKADEAKSEGGTP